jgi:hypothetical protein
MPYVDRVILGLRLAVVADNSVEDSIATSDTTFLVDNDEMDNVIVEILEEDEFTAYNDEVLYQMAVGIANESISQIFDSLLDSRTQLRAATEEVETIEMLQNQEPDWEV